MPEGSVSFCLWPEPSLSQIAGQTPLYSDGPRPTQLAEEGSVSPTGKATQPV